MLQEWHNLWDSGIGGYLLHVLAHSRRTRGLSDTLLQRVPSRLSPPTVVEPIQSHNLYWFFSLPASLPHCLYAFWSHPSNHLHQNSLHRSAVVEIPVKTIRPSSGGFYVGQQPQWFIKNPSWLRLINPLPPGDTQLQLIAAVQVNTWNPSIKKFCYKDPQCVCVWKFHPFLEANARAFLKIIIFNCWRRGMQTFWPYCHSV